MGSHASQLAEEQSHVDRCVRGDHDALGRLREKCHEPLLGILLARGASRIEADDLLADLWADCLCGADDRPSLLEKFNGRCPLLNWLATVATRRWIDLKRRQTREVSRESLDEENPDDDPGETTSLPNRESALGDLLHRSLKAAFAQCSPETLVLLRLRYLHDVSQRELVRMLGWHESKVSRSLSRAMKEVEDATLNEIRKQDPWLTLTWQDFLDLCESQQTGFL
jgi:RNA polymerase sigma factor (sigma-70 family)